MALIDCPECGSQVSDAAKACVNCGYPLPERRCPECSSMLREAASHCPTCGQSFHHIPLKSPRPPMPSGPTEWWLRGWKRGLRFGGRASRSEYWWFTTGNAAIMAALVILDGVMGTIDAASGVGMFSGFFLVLVLLPSVSATVRRFHDSGYTGWWVLVSLVPFFGPLVLLLFMALESEARENLYGSIPHTSSSAAQRL